MTGRELKERWLSDDWSERDISALIDEAIANDVYDEAVCCTQEHHDMTARDYCIGENHIETCPVLIAWQDRKAASDKRRGMR